MIPPRRRTPLLFLFLCLALLPATHGEESPALGLWWSGTGNPAPGDGEASTFVRVEARFPGETAFDWETFAATVDGLAASGRRVVVTLAGAPDLADTAALDAWVVFARRVVETGGSRLAAVQIGDELADPEGHTAYAFLLKTTALAVRAEARAVDRPILIVLSTVPVERAALQHDLWTHDVAPYIDVIPLRLGTLGGQALAERLGQWTVATLQHPPAPRLWAIAGSGDTGERASSCLEALAAGVAVAMIEEEGSDPALDAWLDGTHSLISEDFAPAPLSGARLIDTAGDPIPGGRPLLRLFNAETASTLVFYRAPGEGLDSPTDRLVLSDRAMRDTEILDPAVGEGERIGSAPFEAGRSVRVRRGDLPLAVRFVRPSGPLDLPPEAVETTATREPTVEEILAQYRQVQREQDDRLERTMARGRMDMHFKVGGGGSTIDYSVEANYFWQRGGQMEWEETDYFINNNRLKWKNIPEIPLIQPEKVVTLPLDLTLDKTYGYRKVGRDKVDGRDAWVLAFEPTDPDAPLSLYRGRIWVDAETFVRLKTNLIQTQLEPPVLSNEEIDLYKERTGPDGESYWLLDSVDGQQIWNAAGRNFVVQRELTFWDVRINPPLDEFEAARNQAYAGDNRMMRDTEQGVRYLDPTEDGERVVREGLDSGRLFLLGGAFKDQSTDGVRPLAGVNYLNFDLWGRDIQINAFLAGLVNFVTFSDPTAFGRNWDVTANLGVSALKSSDQVFSADTELFLEQIDVRDQNLSVSMGIPLGKFVKLNLSGGGRYVQFFEDSETRDAITANNANPLNPQVRLILPPDHFEYESRLGLRYDRRGWTIRGAAQAFRRSEFSRFGLVEETTGTPLRFDPVTMNYVTATAEPVRETFARYSLTANKEWFLPKFQRIRVEANVFDGNDLDRFSKYQFSLFGNTRLNGFAGSGVRFDNGRIGRLGYSFSVFEAIRFDAVLESAWVEELSQSLGVQNHGGFGVAANFVAPWKLVFQLSYGRALWSDIPELEGQDEFLLVVLRLF